MKNESDIDARTRFLSNNKVEYNLRSNRSKKRKMKKESCALAAEVNSSSVSTEDDLSCVRDNVIVIPRPEKIQNRLSVMTTDGNLGFKSRSSKKVSFNAVVDSHFINEETLYFRKNARNRSPPRSILKQTSFTMRKSKRKKTKIKTRMIKKSVSKIVESGIPKQTRAFAYLDTWKHHNVDWKFEKVIQTWLLKNMFDDSMMPNEKFDLLLEYLADMRGAAVLLAKQLSMKLIENSKQTSGNNDDITLKSSYRRAELVLQTLKK